MSAVSPDLLTEQEFSDLTGLTLSAIRAYRQYGGGPPIVRVGQTPLYPREALRAWVAQNIRMANAPRLMYRQWLRDSQKQYRHVPA